MIHKSLTSTALLQYSPQCVRQLFEEVRGSDRVLSEPASTFALSLIFEEYDSLFAFIVLGLVLAVCPSPVLLLLH